MLQCGISEKVPKVFSETFQRLPAADEAVCVHARTTIVVAGRGQGMALCGGRPKFCKNSRDRRPDGAGTNPGLAAYRQYPEIREIFMMTTRISWVAAAALTIVSSAAVAQQAQTGTVTKIDRTSGIIAIKPLQSGTVGASTPGAPEYKVQRGVSLEDWHAGDQVSFTVTESGGARTVTKIEKPTN
jgi:Cu/Ag efflux protein CusF